jgi:hypothetical protein
MCNKLSKLKEEYVTSMIEGANAACAFDLAWDMSSKTIFTAIRSSLTHNCWVVVDSVKLAKQEMVKMTRNMITEGSRQPSSETEE